MLVKYNVEMRMKNTSFKDAATAAVDDDDGKFIEVYLQFQLTTSPYYHT